MTEDSQIKICKAIYAEKCFGKHNRYHKDNCSHCMLRKGNYAGWARIYVLAGVSIPKELRAKFMQELDSDNEVYRKALVEDIINYGVTIN